MVSAPRREAAVPKLDARACGILKKCERDRFSAQRREFFQGMALDFLERFALIEKKSKFVRGERFKSQEIAETRRHIGPAKTSIEMPSKRNTSAAMYRPVILKL